jgi:hypothetical protein
MLIELCRSCRELNTSYSRANLLDLERQLVELRRELRAVEITHGLRTCGHCRFEWCHQEPRTRRRRLVLVDGQLRDVLVRCPHCRAELPPV